MGQRMEHQSWASDLAHNLDLPWRKDQNRKLKIFLSYQNWETW